MRFIELKEQSIVKSGRQEGWARKRPNKLLRVGIGSGHHKIIEAGCDPPLFLLKRGTVCYDNFDRESRDENSLQVLHQFFRCLPGSCRDSRSAYNRRRVWPFSSLIILTACAANFSNVRLTSERVVIRGGASSRSN